MTVVKSADVFKKGVLAARLHRNSDSVNFSYDERYLAANGPAVASTLPVVREARITPAGAAPPFFAGLLPEGRRLSALRRSVKTSADDELSLLVAAGNDTIGDVQVLPTGQVPANAPPPAQLSGNFSEIRFSRLESELGISSSPTIAGVQDKISASMISVPVARQHERYILKLNPPDYPHLVQNEAFFIELARTCGLTPSAARIVVDADGEPGLLITRFDRVPGEVKPLALASEDACQALDLWPADKYNTSMEDAADALIALTKAKPIAARNVLRQLIFAWLTGNGDLHSKNLSVLEFGPAEVTISPAYDLPSTLFYGDDTLALTVAGRDTLSAKRLRMFGDHLALPLRAIERTLGEVLAGTVDLSERVASGALPFDARVNTKVARQLAIRHRDLSAGL